MRNISVEWRDLTDDELADFTIAVSEDRIGDPEETPDWYMLFENRRLRGHGSVGGAIVHADDLCALVWTTTSDRELRAVWRDLVGVCRPGSA